MVLIKGDTVLHGVSRLLLAKNCRQWNNKTKLASLHFLLTCGKLSALFSNLTPSPGGKQSHYSYRIPAFGLFFSQKTVA